MMLIVWVTLLLVVACGGAELCGCLMMFRLSGWADHTVGVPIGLFFAVLMNNLRYRCTDKVGDCRVGYV